MASFRFPDMRVSLMVIALVAAVGVVPLMLSAVPAGAGNNHEPLSSRFKKKQTDGGTASSAATGNWTASGTSGGGKATTQTGIVSDGSVSPFLLPDSEAAMQAVLGRYEAIVSAGGWGTVPSAKYKKGLKGKAAEALNQRLHVEGYLRKEAVEGEYREVFTSATEDAVKRFQRNHGLAVTGTPDNAMLRELNVPAARRLAALRANAPRVAEYSKELGSRYMVVNIPAMQIETVSDGRVYSRHNAVVGRPSRPTPVVMTPLATIRFNPYWNAPHSIVEKDILPRMVSGGASKVMREMNMKIFKGVGGPEIDPDSVNWRRAVVDDYHFRQEPGGSNAMATAKIEFLSPFGIYLHDTPEPQLFTHGQRFYSSGCVRVEQVATLIDWILQGQDGIDRNRIASLAETKERLDKTISDPPQLRVTYLTAWPTREGVAAFRPDIYELDGSGFVVGQPLPVGESSAGKRYVLKPVPRSPQAVDADEFMGFASLFRTTRNPDKEAATVPVRSSAASAPDASKRKTAADKPARKTALTNWGSAQPEQKKKKAVTAKTAKQKKKLTAATKDDPKKKPASASRSEAKKTKTVTNSTSKTVAATKKPADAGKAAETGKKPPASCKPAKDGKLPDGCKAAAATKKPADNPEKTATAAN